MMQPVQTVGDHLRAWRQRRRMSQLDLACEADISTRHLSFLETGRAQPSRSMVLRLAERLDVPLRERNVLLVAAGFAPVFTERRLDDPALSAARAAVEQVLAGHDPFPALAVDRHWNLVAANRAVTPLLAGVPADLLQPPVNVLRLALHPDGLAPRTVNLAEWRGHLLARLRRQIELTAEPTLIGLLEELDAYPAPRPPGPRLHAGDAAAAVAVPFRLRGEDGVLSFFSTVTVFGTPLDITLAELAIEAFFPADAETAARLRGGAAPAAM
ncbi:MAG TPA: helix-turn-helix transcriptional regulator [Stellaceae bacterium]|nr:helix-turn-helix transcriptional regulator [Stellaceae bacterium]